MGHLLQSKSERLTIFFLTSAIETLPVQAISERDLPICPPNAVCSVLHNRYWMSPIVKRLCRCLRRIECPWEWTDYPDNNTMHLDNRSQLKARKFDDPIIISFKYQMSSKC